VVRIESVGCLVLSAAALRWKYHILSSRILALVFFDMSTQRPVVVGQVPAVMPWL
jgi:hypothetical protein